MNKKRILFIGEASFLNTGFSTYYRELLPRLAATGKYEIAELGSYARPDDPRVGEFIKGRWKFYGAMPMTHQEGQIFNQACPHPRARGQNTNQFGEWKFNGVLLDFKPDIVVDIRDWWMLEYQERSVFRPWYKWLVMPTVDAEPQMEEWVSTYENANMVLAYSDYGVHTLRRQSQLMPNNKGRMRIFPKAMRPGVDLSVFKPMIRDDVRDYWNINKTDKFPIIGTVMRNQSRKLYPDLIDGFSRMKEKYKGESQVDKAALLIHSAWPDNMHSYDYPRHVMRLEAYKWMPYHNKGIRGSVLQTMFCTECKQASIGFVMNLWGRPIQDNRIKLPCPQCGKNEASTPNTNTGFDRETLAKLYNLMDLYVQCSICEGDGMPIQEAKACGVPTLVTDYTAMREKGRYPDYPHFSEVGYSRDNYSCHKGGEVIDIGRYYYEPETSCKRALPNIEDLADKMRNIISDQGRLQQLRTEARQCAEQNYDWNTLWQQWEYVLDNVKVIDRASTWDSPIQVHDTIKAETPPGGLSNKNYVDWLYLNILKYPHVDTNGAAMWIHHLENGVTREQLMQQFILLGNQQGDSTKVRDEMRQQYMAQTGSAVVSPQSKTQEFI